MDEDPLGMFPGSFINLRKRRMSGHFKKGELPNCEFMYNTLGSVS
jgi:hypothetical protein